MIPGLHEAAEKYVDPDEAPRLAESALRRLADLRARSGKTCAVCHETKPLGAFHADTRRPDGLRTTCRSCRAV